MHPVTIPERNQRVPNELLNVWPYGCISKNPSEFRVYQLRPVSLCKAQILAIYKVGVPQTNT